jgi:hypothetical protein
MCGLVTDLAAGALDQSAQNKARKAQQGQLNATTAMQGAEFDKRMGMARGSDQRVGDLLNQEHSQEGALQDQTFGDLLAQNAGSFNAQSDVTKRAYDEQMAATQGLMTSTRQARLDQAATSEAERQRQVGFQDQADVLASAFPGQVGATAQARMMGDALTGRNALTASTVSGPTNAAPAGSGDLVSREFAKQSNRGVGDALATAQAGNKVSSYGDAFAGAERNISGFADAINGLTQKAGLSRAALPDELAPGGVARSNAQDRYQQTVADSQHHAQQLGDMLTDYGNNMTGAISSRGTNLGSALSNFFGGRLSSEGDFTTGMTGSSQHLQDTLTNLNNFKMSQTVGYSPLATVMRTIANSVNNAARAYAGGGAG